MTISRETLARLTPREKNDLAAAALECMSELGRHLEWSAGDMLTAFDETLRDAAPSWARPHGDQSKADARWWADLGGHEYDEEIRPECDLTGTCEAGEYEHEEDCPRFEE